MPQTDPFRLHLMKNLTAVLEEITVLNGYHVDLASDLITDPDNPVIRVWRGRQEYGETDPLPMLCILEVPLQPDQIPTPAGGTAQTGPFDMIVQGFIKDDPLHPTDPAHVFAADVEMRLALEKAKEITHGGLTANRVLGCRNVTKLNFARSVVRPPDNLSSVAYFWLPVTLILAEELADPYSDRPWT